MRNKLGPVTDDSPIGTDRVVHHHQALVLRKAFAMERKRPLLDSREAALFHPTENCIDSAIGNPFRPKDRNYFDIDRSLVSSPRRILPTLLFGKLSAKSMSWGILYGAI